MESSGGGVWKTSTTAILSSLCSVQARQLQGGKRKSVIDDKDSNQIRINPPFVCQTKNCDDYNFDFDFATGRIVEGTNRNTRSGAFKRRRRRRQASNDEFPGFFPKNKEPLMSRTLTGSNAAMRILVVWLFFPLGAMSQTTTASPTKSPSTAQTTTAVPSPSPTFNPTTTAPTTAAPTTLNPTFAPSTSRPSLMPSLWPSQSFPPSQMPSSLFSSLPSLKPSLSPTQSDSPSISPTSLPSLKPSLNPTQSKSPSISPTSIPSLKPSLSPTQSKSPSISPTSLPSSLPSLKPSLSPTRSESPSLSPTSRPSPQSSAKPSLSLKPSLKPSHSFQPTADPTKSPEPSVKPTNTPTVSALPTTSPTRLPTSRPSSLPSGAPSVVPTRAEALVEERSFRQQLLIESGILFTPEQMQLFGDLYGNYTLDYWPGAKRVNDTCHVTDQQGFRCNSRTRNCILENSTIPLNQTLLVDVDYLCVWTSVVTNVSDFPEAFELFINGVQEKVKSDMRGLGLPVLRVFDALATGGFKNIPSSLPTIPPTPSPTLLASRVPSMAPSTHDPTQVPSSSPSPAASRSPSASPLKGTTNPPDVNVIFPVGRPTAKPTSKNLNSSTNPDSGSDGGAIIVIAVVTIGVLTFVLIFLIWYRRWRNRKNRPARYEQHEEDEDHIQDEPNSFRKSDSRNSFTANNVNNKKSWLPRGQQEVGPPRDESKTVGGVAIVSPSVSVVSRQSLLSAGESGFGMESDVEADNTRNLQDEFDLYKDQNLEQLRIDVEENVQGFEGIMSAAVTSALMGDEYPLIDLSNELTWGCPANASGAEIEASVLCEVNEWMKRAQEDNSGPVTLDQKRSFMQELLNRMVSSVRFGVLPAEDASRTIHESAALLGLQLAHQLPTTTIIISGMRKTTDGSHITTVLSEFGTLGAVAVASGNRGFGIVRFASPKSVDRVMQRYRRGEIVIQDVAISMKALTPNGQIDSRSRK